MNHKFTGKCIDSTIDKRGTLYLIIEDSLTGTPDPQKVKCWGRGIDAAARAIRKGDIVHVEVKQAAFYWQPKDGREPGWLDGGMQATFIEVRNSHTAGSREQPDDDLPF